MTESAAAHYVLTLRSEDHPGILAALTQALLPLGGDIRDAVQYGDPDTGLFFVRLHFTVPPAQATALGPALQAVATREGFDCRLHELARPLRSVIAVSRDGHCLNDLLHRWQAGQLPTEIVAIVSNHEDLRPLAEWHGLRFVHLPTSPERRAEQEAALLGLLEQEAVDLLVLARYMQILSDDLCRQLAGRCINIHHSFLPSFKGARPYHRAHARGVKLIGATAHYVTADLDEGPIIEQDVIRVNHATSAAEMVAQGREVEARVLARAVRWHLEHRVMLDGHKTVVFS